MKVSLKNMDFKLNCPNCGTELKTKVKDVGSSITCKSCGKEIHLEDKNFSSGIKEAEKQIADFMKSMKRHH